MEGDRFGIIIDPSRCKGCAKCVTVSDDLALEMISKTEKTMETVRKSQLVFKDLGPTDERYVNDNLLQHRLHTHLAVQSLPGSMDDFSVRKCSGGCNGFTVAVGSEGLGGQAVVVYRWRRSHV